MPSVFDRMFKQSGFPVLLQQNGETVTYLPRAGGRRSIKAIIERNPPEMYDAAGQNVVLYAFTVRVAQDCKSGIQDSEVNTGGDRIELLADVNDVVPTTKKVMKIVSRDSSVLTLALM